MHEFITSVVNNKTCIQANTKTKGSFKCGSFWQSKIELFRWLRPRLVLGTEKRILIPKSEMAYVLHWLWIVIVVDALRKDPVHFLMFFCVFNLKPQRKLKNGFKGTTFVLLHSMFKAKLCKASHNTTNKMIKCFILLHKAFKSFKILRVQQYSRRSPKRTHFDRKTQP